jgi:quercetin dioxygenase-like cupin family protein
MPIRVYDYRRDIRNLEITPEIRARFMRLGPHETADRHSHDLGHEVFLVLEGRMEVEANGERAVLGPGQFAFSRANEHHQVRNLGDTPVILYLSVTPHIEPTHTFWSEDGERLPPRYGGTTAWSAPDAEPAGPQASLAELAERQAAALRQLQEALGEALAAQERLDTALKQHGDDGPAPDDAAALKASIDAMWEGLRPLFRAAPQVAAAWNELAVAAAGPARGRG